METRFITDYNDGACLEILGDDNNTYIVQFYDNKNGELIHQAELKCNHWTRTTRKYFTEWKIVVLLNNVEVFSEIFDCRGKDVLIFSNSSALGDTIAHSPYFEEFRKKYDCNLTVISSLWQFLKDYYPNIKWMKGDLPIHEYGKQYASYSMFLGIDKNIFEDGMEKINNSRLYGKTPIPYIKGLTFFDKSKHPEHPLLLPIQKQVTNVLGLEYKEIRPHFDVNLPRPIDKKYISISEFASGPLGGLKTWNNKIGWKTLIAELKNRGYEIVSISKEKSDLKNIIKRNGNYSLVDRMQYLKHAEFFIGVSSGLAWLNWEVGKKTVMISGFTEVWHEFQEDNIRIKNEDVCGGCYNSIEHCDKLCCNHMTFCATGKNFECTRKISPKMVMDKIIENELI